MLFRGMGRGDQPAANIVERFGPTWPDQNLPRLEDECDADDDEHKPDYEVPFDRITEKGYRENTKHGQRDDLLTALLAFGPW